MIVQQVVRDCIIYYKNVSRVIIGGGFTRHLSTWGTDVRSALHQFKYDSVQMNFITPQKLLLTRQLSCVASLRHTQANCFLCHHKMNQRLKCGLFMVPYREAGHSKWQNIKHIKAAKDAARATLFSKLARQIKIAIQLGKHIDPKLNPQLANVVDMAKRAMMPVAKIDSIIKSSVGSKDAVMTSYTLEAKGPGGCFIIIELLSDNVNRALNNVRTVLKRHGVKCIDGIKHAFKHKGLVAVDPSISKLDLETAVEIAIEVGAEDVVEGTENDGTPILQFVCEPQDFYKVKTALSEKGYSITTSKLCYLPEMKVSLSDEELETMGKICEVLNEQEDVDAFYDNVE